MTNGGAPSSTFEYGDVQLNYHSDPTDMNYYRIDIIDNKLSIPNSQILTNKNLYEYSTMPVHNARGIKNSTLNDHIYSDLVDSTYCCDYIMNKQIVHNYEYDNAKNRYGTEKEEYFD
jgi:hypothetical protein